MTEKRIAVIFPGIGYHKDKPLLYYSAKIAKSYGFEIVNVEYSNMPEKVKGNPELMKKAADIAYEQALLQLEEIDFESYGTVLFIGKSLGTVVLNRFSTAKNVKALQVLYTPVEATFSYNSGNRSIAFIGDNDPWSELSEIEKLAENQKIPLHIFKKCNHSLECEDVRYNIGVLSDAMLKTDRYIIENV